MDGGPCLKELERESACREGTNCTQHPEINWGFQYDNHGYSDIWYNLGVGMAIRQIFGPFSDSYKNPSKKMADSPRIPDFLFF